MSVHFEKAAVKEIRRETADCVSIVFDIPSHLQEKFHYKQGQYVTLRTHINGQEVRRTYSLCSSPLDNEWRIAVKKVPGGLFSTYANETMQPGEAIDLMPPMGRFYTELDASHKKNYVALAAGSGITPVISIIQTLLRTEPKSSCTLVYGNRNRHSIIFREELEALKNKYMDRFSMIHILSREITDAALNTGHIDADKCDALFNRMIDIEADEFFICGPESMIFCVRDFLLDKGVSEKKVHVELFTSEHVNRGPGAVKPVVSPDEPTSSISIIQDGHHINFALAYEGESILDAALHHGADLPYSCKGGVCCTCRAKLLEGQVEMDINYGLEPEELEAGFILTCQSHPRTPAVVIDFDAK